MALVALVATAARTADAHLGPFPELAYELGHGKNVVNVALVDLRGWDTMGELSVLILAATGVASLVFVTHRADTLSRSPRRCRRSAARARRPARRDRATACKPRGDAPGTRRTRLARRRSARAAREPLDHPRGDRADPVPHDHHRVAVPAVRRPQPARRRLRRRARRGHGARHALRRGRPLRARRGRPDRRRAPARRRHGDRDRVRDRAAVLRRRRRSRARSSRPTCPSLGHIEFVTSTLFDIGVYLVVIGLVLDVLRSLGAEVDRQAQELRDGAERAAGGERADGRLARPHRRSWPCSSRAASTRCSSAASRACSSASCCSATPRTCCCSS